MIFSKHPNFIDTDTLTQINRELTSSANWMFRNKFWRYYVANGLNTYNEANEASWYGNQPAIKSINDPWNTLFNRVYELAGPNFVLMRYALTGQTQGQEQELHRDTSLELTGDFRSYLMYLNSEWNHSWAGATDFVQDNQLIHQEFPEPGKLIEFDSQALHVGHAPNIPNFLRLSLVLHGRLTT